LDAAYGTYKWLAAILLSCYVLYDALNPQSPQKERALFVLLLASVSVFVAAKHGRPKWYIFLLQQFVIVAAIMSFGYIILNADDLEFRLGLTTNTDVFFGVVAIILIIVMTQRLFGWTLPIMAVVFLLYARFGTVVPEFMGGGLSNYSVDRIITFVYLSTNGFFGTVIAVMLKFVFLFVMFGVVLEHTGALGFLMDLSRALLGKVRGGPAFVSVLASGLMGSVSGSAVANVTVTGAVTIPLMKRIGFKPAAAGGIEAAASTGGQFMPPIMGASAFLIAEFLNISYVEVVSGALVPALLFFTGIMVAVWMHVRREGIGLVDEDVVTQSPRFRDVIRQREGLVTIGGLGMLITLLLMKFSPTYAALYSMAAMTALSWLTKEHRITPVKGITILKDAGTSNAALGMAAACVGIIVGALLLTGLSVRMSSLILDATGGIQIALLFGVTLASIILGMGLPTSITYVILAITLAPAVIASGVLPLSAHLFIFYMGMMAMVTPPVAFAAYAAATIARTGFMGTAFQALRMSLPAYFIAFGFASRPGLTMQGEPAAIVLTILLTLGVIVVVAYVTNGKWVGGRITYAEKAIVLIGAFMLMINGPLANFTGLGLVVIGLTRSAILSKGMFKLPLRSGRAA